MGFRDLAGIDDFAVPTGLRKIKFNFLELLLRHRWSVPYRLIADNFVGGPLATSRFDLAACISVIEHEVGLEAFFKEAFRILKPGGIFFVTTDYWEEKMTTPGTAHFGDHGWEVLIGRSYKLRFCQPQKELVSKISAPTQFHRSRTVRSTGMVCAILSLRSLSESHEVQGQLNRTVVNSG
jgi:SAM-dependent methyltransferase